MNPDQFPLPWLIPLHIGPDRRTRNAKLFQILIGKRREFMALFPFFPFECVEDLMESFAGLLRIDPLSMSSLFFYKVNQTAAFLRKYSGNATSLRHKDAAMICFPRSVTRHLWLRGILAINLCASKRLKIRLTFALCFFVLLARSRKWGDPLRQVRMSALHSPRI